MKITFSLFLKYWFLLTCLVNWICIYIWLILILWLFLFVQLSNQPPIINTYLNISMSLSSIHSKHLSCMNVESCFWKCLNLILYVLNVLWNKWNNKKKLTHHHINNIHNKITITVITIIQFLPHIYKKKSIFFSQLLQKWQFCILLSKQYTQFKRRLCPITFYSWKMVCREAFHRWCW